MNITGPTGTNITKRQLRRAYRDGDIGLPDAVNILVLDFGMDRGEAFRYLGL